MNHWITRILLSFVCVLLTDGATMAEDLVVAPAEAPMYRLSKIRIENEFGHEFLMVDYQRTRENTGSYTPPHVSGKMKDGQLTLRSFRGLDKSGTGTLRIRIDTMFGASKKDFEVYFVIGSSRKYLVSNIVRIGNPGPASSARQLTAKEKEAMARAKLFRTPPASLPDGYQAVDQSTKLLPGMPVKAGYYSEWKDAEVIRFKVAGPVFLKYEGGTSLESHLREKWIAVDPKVLSQAQADPSQFKASVRTLPDGSLFIPDGAVALAENVELLPGTPLLLDWHGGKWMDVFAVEEQGDQVGIRARIYGPSSNKPYPRTKLLITEEVLAKLSGADRDATKEEFAKNIAGRSSRPSNSPGANSNTLKKGEAPAFPGRSGDGKSTIRHKNYEIKIPIPKAAQLVPDDLTIEKGTALAACWGRRWRPITALGENEDGSLHVHWDEFSDSWDCDMTRNQLIIEDKTVRKLSRKKKAPEQSEDDLKKVLRTWTDVTGEHKVEARYVSRTEKAVIIKTDTGREITMPIEKLSESDRALLPELKAKTENPFE